MKCIFKLESSEENFRLFNGIKWLNLENNKEYEIEFNFQKNGVFHLQMKNLKSFLMVIKNLKWKYTMY